MLATLASWPRPFKNSCATHRLPYLYGCIAADIVQAKKYTRSLYTHCHCWPVGWQILEAARGEREHAFAYGYLSHLAADVFSHNHFVPVQLVTSFEARTLRHVYWEARFDAAQERDRWRLIRTVFEPSLSATAIAWSSASSSARCSRSGRTSASSTRSWRCSSSSSGRCMVRGLAARSRYPLPQPRSSASTHLRRRNPGHAACTASESACQHADPTGREAIARAERPRRKLRALSGRGQMPDAIVAELARALGAGRLTLSARGARGRVAAARPPARDPVEDARRRPRPSAAAAAPRRARCASIRRTTFVSTPKPASGAVTSFATIRSSRFSRSLRRASATTSCVSAAKPTSSAPRPSARPSAAEDVGVALELERERRRPLLELPAQRLARPVVGDRRRHHDHRRASRTRPRAPLHLARRVVDRHDPHARRRPERRRPAHQRDLGAAPARDARDARSPSCRSTGSRGSARDRSPPASGPRRRARARPRGPAASSTPTHRLDDLVGLGEPPRALVAARERAARRADDPHAPRRAAGARFSCTAACSHMWTFIAGATTMRRARREQHGREQIVRDAVRQLRDHVRGRRRDHDDVGRVGEPDVADLGLLGQVEGVGGDRVPGERLQRERRDELCAPARHDDVHARAACTSRRTTSHAL